MSKILGIDFGTKRIGLAISDTNRSQAFVYNTLNIKNLKQTLFNIKKICDKELISEIVIGLPLGLSGKATNKTTEVINFAHKLEYYTKLAVKTEDERLSSSQARRRKDGHGIDESAAQIILQQYLDRNQNIS